MMIVVVIIYYYHHTESPVQQYICIYLWVVKFPVFITTNIQNKKIACNVHIDRFVFTMANWWSLVVKTGINW